MEDNLLEKLTAHFDILPSKIFALISIIPERELDTNVWKLLQDFHCNTLARWDDAIKIHNVSCLYALPEDVFNKIQTQNLDNFIECWNKTLSFIYNQAYNLFPTDHICIKGELLKLYLLVRTHLTYDYGYFDLVDKNKLFRINDENTNKS